MQFNSIPFLFAFFPIFLVLFRLTPIRLSSGFLVLSGLVFYGLSTGSWFWAGFLLLLTFLGWLGQLALGTNRRRLLLPVFLALLGLILVFFKLYRSGSLLPAGMSFYSFQLAAWLIDVCRQRVAPEKRFLPFAQGIVLFPKLLSGPLVSPAELAEQAGQSRFTRENVYEGIRLLILGLAMKVLLANRLGGLWSEPGVIGYAHISTPAAWMALTAYAMQLYLDFWGYSLMAIGLGRTLGYRLPENFLDPYCSRSVSEFYRRWHATLGAWFREYVYFPLGGSRAGTLRTVGNLAVVWLFTGLWHGIGGNYLLWAGFLLLWILAERFFLKKLLDRCRLLSHIYVIAVIFLSWIPFAIGDRAEMLTFLGRLFGCGGPAANPRDFLPWVRMYAGLLCAGGLLMTSLPRKLWNRIKHHALTDLLLLLLFWLSVYYIATAAQDPFLYFQY